MQLYDSHAHFTADAEQVNAILDRARTAGVTRVLAIGGDDPLNEGALLAAQQNGESVSAVLGYDRDQSGKVHEDLVGKLRDLCQRHHPVAVGEIGLDFHYSPDTAKDQCDLLAHELTLADALGLPVVIHTREADDATLGVLDEIPWHGTGLRGVIHCYTGAPKFAGQCLDRGFMISFSGIITFKSAECVRESARYVPEDRLLIETDSPFLAPIPLRGQTNEPAYIVHTARYLAQLRNLSEERLSALTFANTLSLFHPSAQRTPAIHRIPPQAGQSASA